MNKKLLFLSTVISAGIVSFTGTASAADDRHPEMPQGGAKCYPGKKGCPNRIESVEGSRYGDDKDHGRDRKRNGRERHNDRHENGKKNGKKAKHLKMQSAEKFKGTVESVNRERYPNGRLFINVTLTTDEGQMKVMVGPAQYVDMSKVKLQVGDKITVTGFRVDANGDEVIMAKEIDKNGNVLKLLNDQRQPMWGNGNGYGNNGNRR